MLKPDKEYGINGNIISAVFYKSRTNASNVDVELIFDKQNGFSKCLTLLHFGINNNIVKKQGNKLVIPGCEDDPFSKKDFCDHAAANPMLLVKLYDLCLPLLQNYLGVASPFGDNDFGDNDDGGSNDDLMGLFDDYE